MRCRVGIPAAVAAVSVACGMPDSRGAVHRDSVRVGAMTRLYELRVPAGQRTAPRPLLLAFHGTGESGQAMRRATALDSLAAREGFLVAYLDAAVGNWAEGCACSRADLEGIDDTGFVRRVVDDLDRRHGVDRRRVYAVGFSQGGLFVQRLACQMGDLVVAVASVSAPMSSRVAEGCAPAAPVGVLVIQGTLDDAYRYEGERRGGLSLLGARETVRLWTLLNGCDGGPRARQWPDAADDGTRVLEERWLGCRQDVPVSLYTVEGGRHAWQPSADVPTETLLVRHFRYVRQPGGASRPIRAP